MTADPKIKNPPPGGATPHASWPRRLALWAYRIVRPVVRPIVWRTRTFLTRDVLLELAEIRATQNLILAHIAAGSGASPVVEAGTARTMERLLLTLALENARDPAPPGLLPPLAGQNDQRVQPAFQN